MSNASSSVQSGMLDDGTVSAEFGMMFDILLTMPDSFRAKTYHKKTVCSHLKKASDN